MSLSNIPKERYYNNQLLEVSDFQREQNYHIAHRNLQTQHLFSAGILTGLGVIQDSSSSSKINIIQGVALDNTGQQILLISKAIFNGQSISAQNGVFIISLDNQDYYNADWLLSIKYKEVQATDKENEYISSPTIALTKSTNSPQQTDASTIYLARISVTA